MDVHELPRGDGAGLQEDILLPGPSVWVSRSVVWLALLLALVAAAWAAWVRVDVVVTARGRLVVEGEPVTLTVPEEGLVVDVPCALGGRVRAGDVVMRLRAVRHGADAAQLSAEARALGEEAARHEQAAREAHASLGPLEDELRLARELESLLEDDVVAWKARRERGIVTVVQVQEKERELLEARSRVAGLEGQLRSARDQVADRRRQAAEARTRSEGVGARLLAVEESERLMTLTAPVAGTVIRLGVLHAGAALGPGEAAVVIEPEGLPLLAALSVPNASMRGLLPGQRTRMRLDAYPHADHGAVEGRLLRIEPEPDADGAYRAWSSLDAAEDARALPLATLRAGLQLEADVVVERRRLLDLALQPLRRLDEPLTVSE